MDANIHYLSNPDDAASQKTFSSENRQMKKITKLYVFNEKAVIHNSPGQLDHQLHAIIKSFKKALL